MCFTEIYLKARAFIRFEMLISVRRVLYAR